MAYESSAARIAAQLRTEILHGDLAPGSKLAQVGLAERFGVSRIPVRDALAILTGEGLVQPLSNATAVVTRMSVEELQELYDLRVAIEPRTTEIAVPNVGRADILYMRKQLAIMSAPVDARTWLAANTEFHAAVYRRANRPRTVELIEQLRRLTDRYVFMHLEVSEQGRHIGAEHDDILAAVERGDAAMTARLTREHLARAHDSILGYLDEHPSVLDRYAVLSP
ncbi:GntR family transcriptional regulator [Mycolicibacterium moriokaense]|jgi:DNA-binding GntR family transcriptional regulator|uniref:GntR family transcriptional regulator n=1 Tax=Mycolicibacterium moriokaense TaxID=39691 RepID=A0AAD1HBX6_9MYCO|nr:GntR family transcriptional regulator [Mycolicibacterium moriokaense]MCV7040023.1 GntR family transcriptional regulator [Mycolicibacterium moriokaense]ORB15466.1 GntR family transcriptional regulator [Mycolicibacterium moriokaense]BBX02051.1 GntR family transcriptional regulator [Mycolicibacterium moriokaense]